MLFVFLIVFYLSSMISSIRTKAEILKDVTPLDVASVKTYVESCLNKVASRAVQLVGRSGGVIYIQNSGFLNETYTVEDMDFVESVINRMAEGLEKEHFR